VNKAGLRNLAGYMIAALIIWYAARGVSWGQLLDVERSANVWMFAGFSTVGFLCWFIGETFLYSRLFSYVHSRTRPLELLPTMYSVYFLQIVNSYVASGALLLFLHVRRRIPWLMSGFTLLFQGYLDAVLFAALVLMAIALVPTSPIRIGLGVAAVVLGVGCFIASFWLLWGAWLPSRTWLGWLYKRPSMESFRNATFAQYLELMTIRFLIILGAGLTLYGQFVSFHIGISLAQTLAMTPFVVAIGNSPFSPGGIGTTQLAFTMAFARFGSKESLFALSLAVSAFGLLVRIPLGLVIGDSLMREVVEIRSGSSAEYRLG